MGVLFERRRLLTSTSSSVLVGFEGVSGDYTNQRASFKKLLPKMPQLLNTSKFIQTNARGVLHTSSRTFHFNSFNILQFSWNSWWEGCGVTTMRWDGTSSWSCLSSRQHQTTTPQSCNANYKLSFHKQLFNKPFLDAELKLLRSHLFQVSNDSSAFTRRQK